MKLAKSKVHFIGVGGIGMSGLAELLLNMGAKVSGSDLGSNQNTERLSSLGVQIFKGHDSKNISGADVVVYSSAILPQNCEYAKAKESNIPLIPRAEALSEILRLKRGVVVAGTHGKTTTTSMIASIFLQAEKDPTIAVGGRLETIGSNAKLGAGEWMVAESDESDGSFLRLYPEIAVITNIDNDHIDFYGDFVSLKNAFYQFACNIPFYGVLVCFGDDPVIRELLVPFSKRVLYYGFNKDNDFILKHNGPKEDLKYSVEHDDNTLCEYKLPLPGAHNALNALAALIVSKEAGIETQVALSGIEGFKGVGRRFEYKGSEDDILFYDDYGHHPTELNAVFESFSSGFPDKRLVAIFEPHRYTRMKECWTEFVEELKKPDLVFVTKIYEASESPIDGISGENLCKEIPKSKLINISTKAPESELAPWFEKIKAELKPGDVCVTLGAGKINVVGEMLIKYLRNNK